MPKINTQPQNTEKEKKDNRKIPAKSEKQRAMELQETFDKEFEMTLTHLIEIYPRVSRVKSDTNLSKDVFKMVIYSILLDKLRDIQYDCSKLTMNEFHRKYVPNLPILYRCDFTGEEFKKIIEDSYLVERDKLIALKFFVEKKNPSEVYGEINEIGDKKTVGNNLETINNALLYRACIYNNKQKND